MKKLILLSIISLIGFGCSNAYTVSTNLDKTNFTDYFSPTSVTVYENVNEIKTSYQFIGSVEGEDCQLKPHLAEPDEVVARTNARKNAYDMKANGIIFSSCALLPQELPVTNSKQKQCISTLVCYGKAYQINTSES